ncbi:glycosyltransferase family 4 protein [Vibrio alginolyticus]|uniref:glycosyltransferase n=1 Tax=Vibrio TaxID=662 RepID=UPI00211A65AF|nr:MULTISPECIES: glycosyltransferase [unclassified Vibrio]EGR0199564.1 glycosyltransferase family 4 protein [Vibrio alginolyticus]EJE8154125.1 glycosyltransferase family 4 protein [Vibrio alginolyticus]MCQ9060847.1 glycosyltransferase family 4 protein [Vibrio alginolyticus]MDW2148230.1 glycosyltransferase [Vibrio sp. 378]MDW2193310.1 glycosyltransferase [Vibrio sp. 1641]
MKLGVYANWNIFLAEDGFYVEGIHKKYLDQFVEKTAQVTLLCSSSRNHDIPKNFEFVSTQDVKLIQLPDFNSYLGALKKSHSIWNGMKELLSVSDFVYLRTPEPFSWFAAILKKDQVLNYHFTSNPLEVLRGRMKDDFLKNLFKILIFYPEYFLISLSAYFNSCSANGSSVLKNVPFFIRDKIDVLVESSILSTDEFSSPNLLPNESFNFICVSRLQEGKGLELLIEAFSELKKENASQSFSLSIVGNGPTLESLVCLTKKLHIEDDVKFLGFIPNGPELNQVYQEHNIFVNPSISETGPRTLIEALYNNLYCISTDVGYVRDVIDGNDSLGVLVEPNCKKALEASLKSVVQNFDLSDINSINRRNLIEGYTLDSFISNVLKKG